MCWERGFHQKSWTCSPHYGAAVGAVMCHPRLSDLKPSFSHSGLPTDLCRIFLQELLSPKDIHFGQGYASSPGKPLSQYWSLPSFLSSSKDIFECPSWLYITQLDCPRTLLQLYHFSTSLTNIFFHLLHEFLWKASQISNLQINLSHGVTKYTTMGLDQGKSISHFESSPNK